MIVEEKQNPLGIEKIGTLLRKMAIPAIIANVVNALYNIVDQIFIGQGVGYLGNAATNIAFPITTICMAIGLMVGIGAASNFNLALGRKEDKHAREVAGTAVVLLVTAGLMIMSVVLLFLQPLLNLFGATDQILGYASEYAGITAFGIPFFMISIGFNPLEIMFQSFPYMYLYSYSGYITITQVTFFVFSLDFVCELLANKLYLLLLKISIRT